MTFTGQGARKWQVSAAGCLLVLLVAAVVALIGRGGPKTTLGRTEAWLTQRGCVAATPHDARLPLGRFAGVHPDFDNHARRYVAVECTNAGGYLFYDHFASAAALPCHHPGDLSVQRFERIAAREDAGAPCAFDTT
jgi:hypothetical protein